MDDLPDTFEQLAARLESRLDRLERRVDALEHPALAHTDEPVLAAPLAPSATEQAPFAQAGGIFSVLGKAMLGIAGAYLLRAVEESSSLPKLAVAAVAIVYALLWLAAAARVKAEAWLAATIYACTSALILAPMLWELTLRFNVLAPSVTAGILAGFAIAASALAWKRDLAPVFWVGNVTSALVAVALSVATHDLVPFIATLLVMVLACEVASMSNRESSLRPLLAFVADVEIAAFIFVYSSAPSQHAAYKPIGAAELLAPACLFFLIFAASITVRTVPLKRRITAFETGQTSLAFLLAASSLLYFESVTGAAVLGAICLALSAAGYTAVFAVLERAPERRNFRVFATWSAALLLTGSWLLLPPNWLAAWLGAAAVATTALGFRLGRATLKTHGSLYLLVAALACGLPAYVFSALAGKLPAPTAWSVYLFAACAVACYAVEKPRQPELGAQHLVQLIPAALAVCVIAALMLQGLAALGLAGDAHHVALVRTLTTCALALALAFLGSRWQRAELNWIAYAALAFVAAKLLFEDLQHGQLEFIAASIFVFALTLIAVPRLKRMGQRIKVQTPAPSAGS